jgi:hypothetical protein
MKLDFKGLITKQELNINLEKIDEVIEENEYAIIVDKGIGKYVIFDLEFAKNNLEIIEKPDYKNTESTLTLVESMIKTLEDLPSRKSTAKELASLVEVHYGKKASPVVVRARAEENANNKGEYNYFVIETGNIIGLEDGVSFDDYIKKRIIRKIEHRLERQFKSTHKAKFTEVFDAFFVKQLESKIVALTNEELIEMVKSLNKYDIDNDLIRLKK